LSSTSFSMPVTTTTSSSSAATTCSSTLNGSTVQAAHQAAIQQQQLMFGLNPSTLPGLSPFTTLDHHNRPIANNNNNGSIGSGQQGHNNRLSPCSNSNGLNINDMQQQLKENIENRGGGSSTQQNAHSYSSSPGCTGKT